jgi:hypothetical protein
LQLALAASQYSLPAQTMTSSDESPLASQRRTLLAEQKL